MAVLLHLFFSFLRTLESEVLKSCQHSASGVDGTDQFVSAAEADVECQIFRIVLSFLRVNISCGTLQPADHLETSTGAELGV